MTRNALALILAAGLSITPHTIAHLAVQPPAGGGGVGGKNPPEPKTINVSPSQVFTDARDVLRGAPHAQRLTVTVIHKGRTPSSANIVLRIAPGKERSQRDAKVSIDAGDLRIYAADGQLTAVLASNPTTFYRAEFEGPPTLAALSGALHPLPIPELAIFFADGDPVSEPTPLTRGITWSPVTRSIDEPTTPLTITGTIDGRPGPSMTFEYQTVQRDRHKESLLRLRSFTCPIGPASSVEERTLSTISAWIDPGDPASWKIETANRTRVDSLAALGIKIEPTKTPAVEPRKPDAEPAKPADPLPPGPDAPPPAKPDAPKPEAPKS